MKSIVPLVVGFLLLMGVVAATGSLISSQNALDQRMRQSLEVRDRLWQLLSALQDAETGGRGYLITGESRFLEPYNKATPQIDDYFRDVQHLLARTPEHAAAMRDLSDAITRRMEVLNRAIGLYRAGHVEAARGVVRGGLGKVLMDRARGIVTGLGRNEEQALATLKSQTARTVDRMEFLIVAAIIGVVLLAFFAIYDAYRRNEGLLAARDDLRSANSRLRTEAREREDAEERLRHSQKLEALGQLTGGLAHDFNNMLAVIIGNLNLLKRRSARGESGLGRYMDNALEGAERAATLTNRMLAFARRQALQPEAVDMNRLVSNLSELLSRTLGGAIRIETVLAGGLWPVHVDRGQLENALLNLAVNARDAMADGGKLTIETANAHLDDLYAAHHVGVPAGQYVLLAVTDTGAGMTPEIVAKAFDPFFTTKDPGQGTGLGLSQVHGFVHQSGGHVKIYSEPGSGTTVKIYLPRYFGLTDALRRDGPYIAEPPGGDPSHVILVVEDDERVRRMTVDALRELDYTVIHADGGRMALNLLDDHPEVELLLTDIVMPEMNGRQLADIARQKRAALKVLFITGYTRNAVVHNGIVDPGVHLIGKPFTLEQLALKVREVIQSAPEG
ncbi:MAG: response regulator [Alphaproteobacteria bacterium]|nr:response regulator [Alphaproteobacteria bacterium]